MSNQSDILKKMSIHQHNYAGEFGNIVGDPALLLMDELIYNPDIFSEEERKLIVTSFRVAMRNTGRYEMLGRDVSKQLTKVKDAIVPSIKENTTIFKTLISKNCNFKTPYLQESIRWALEKTDEICNKLNNIEYDDKGEAKPTLIVNLVEQKFEEDKLVQTRKGLPSFELSIFGREHSSALVLVDPEGFNDTVLHNLIENFHKYAFGDDVNSPRKTIFVRQQNSWWKKIWHRITGKTVQTYHVSDNKVRILFSQEDPQSITITIENNGVPFPSDIDLNTVFDYEIGEGTGIGLYSAAEFLRKYDSCISVQSTPNEEFTVHFILKIPIYGS